MNSLSFALMPAQSAALYCLEQAIFDNGRLYQSLLSVGILKILTLYLKIEHTHSIGAFTI